MAMTKRRVSSRTALKNKFIKATKLHQILAIALIDLRKAEKMKGVKIDMGDWHRPVSSFDRRICYVCLAGSVIHCRLADKVDLGCNLTPGDYAEVDECQQKLFALNDLRNGWLLKAYEHLYGDDARLPRGVEEEFSVVDYYITERAQWWKDMRALLKYLKAKKI